MFSPLNYEVMGLVGEDVLGRFHVSQLRPYRSRSSTDFPDSPEIITFDSQLSSPEINGSGSQENIIQETGSQDDSPLLSPNPVPVPLTSNESSGSPTAPLPTTRRSSRLKTRIDYKKLHEGKGKVVKIV